MAVQTQIQTRRGTAATWTSTNPTLAAGEIGFETDTNKFKIGTGSTGWTSLAYAANVSPLTTKGDLYTYSTDNTRLAVGNNGETLVADSSTSTGLRYQGSFAAGKNKIINGDFFVNQRNFTSVTANNTYGFDRWVLDSGGDGTVTYTPQTFTLGAAPVSGYEGKNYARLVTASQTLSYSYAALDQKIESVRTFAGQTVTISFWAQAGSGTPKVAIALDQYFGTGGSPSSTVTTTAGTVTLSTSWARYSVTVANPSISGKTLGTNNNDYLALYLITTAGSSYAGIGQGIGLQNATINFWGVQVEAGSVATPFQTMTGSIQGELAACQRYYWRNTSAGGYVRLPMGSAQSTTQMNIALINPVTMRTTPTTLDYSTLGGTGIVITDFITNTTPTVLALDSTFASNPVISYISGTVAAGLVAFRPYTIGFNSSTTGYIGISAEL